MANEKRLIDANALIAEYDRVHIGEPGKARKLMVDAPTVDAYTEEQVAGVIKWADKIAAKNNELEKEVVWLKSCLNCKIRKECPMHCGKVVHNCDHWEYGDNAVEVVYGQWINPYINRYGHPCHCCSVCGFKASYQDKNYCPNCGAKMDGDENA